MNQLFKRHCVIEYNLSIWICCCSVVKNIEINRMVSSVQAYNDTVRMRGNGLSSLQNGLTQPHANHFIFQ